MNVTHAPADRLVQMNGAPGDATCEFAPVRGASSASIRIAVHTMQDHATEYAAFVAKCGPSPRKIVGVGNEAVACVLDDGHAATTEQVVARVRERVFLFSWTMPAIESELNRDSVRNKLQNTAEQIAGSLF